MADSDLLADGERKPLTEIPILPVPLSSSAKRRALRLRLERIRQKILRVEAEIAEAQSATPPDPACLCTSNAAFGLYETGWLT